MCKHDENRYYIARGADSAAAIRNTVDTQVPAHHKAYTQVGQVKHIERDAYYVEVTVLGEDTRNDAGLLREHLTMMVAGYPQATVTHRTVAGRIADLIHEDVDTVLEQAQNDAACLDDAATIVNAIDIDIADDTCATCGQPLNGADKQPAPGGAGTPITQADYDHAWGQAH
jgi:hypothetical protein